MIIRFKQRRPTEDFYDMVGLLITAMMKAQIEFALTYPPGSYIPKDRFTEWAMKSLSVDIINEIRI